MKLKTMLTGLRSHWDWQPGPPIPRSFRTSRTRLRRKPSQADISAARQEVQGAAQSALSALYAIQPSARRDIERAVGYAAFSTFGMKLMIAGGTSGKGMAVNKRTGTQTYMKMLQVQGGLGFGVSKNQLIFVFTNEQALSTSSTSVGSSADRPTCRRWRAAKAACSPAPRKSRQASTSTRSRNGPTPHLQSGTKFFVDSDLN